MTKKFDKHEAKAPISEKFSLFARLKKIVLVTEKVASYIKKVISEIFFEDFSPKCNIHAIFMFLGVLR